MALIDIKGVDFSYNGRPVLAGVDLSVAQGEFLALVGPNGGGKTTLVKLILGLVTPQKGTVRVFGQPPAKVRRRMGYLPQHAPLDPGFPVSALEVVLMGLVGSSSGLGLWRRGQKQAALNALDKLEAADLAGARLWAAVGRPAPAGAHRPGPGGRAGASAVGRAHRRGGPQGRGGSDEHPVRPATQGHGGAGHP